MTDVKNSRLLQVGNNLSESLPVTTYNLASLGLGKVTAPEVYRQCVYDPYATDSMSQVITIIRPIYAPGSKGERRGMCIFRCPSTLCSGSSGIIACPRTAISMSLFPARITGSQTRSLPTCPRFNPPIRRKKEQTFSGTTIVRNCLERERRIVPDGNVSARHRGRVSFPRAFRRSRFPASKGCISLSLRSFA